MYAPEIFFIRYGFDAAEARFERLRQATIALIGDGPVLAALVEAGLGSGWRHVHVAGAAGAEVHGAVARARRDEDQSVRACAQIPDGTDVVLQVHDGRHVEDLLETGRLCAERRIALGQLWVRKTEGWLAPVSWRQAVTAGLTGQCQALLGEIDHTAYPAVTPLDDPEITRLIALLEAAGEPARLRDLTAVLGVPAYAAGSAAPACASTARTAMRRALEHLLLAWQARTAGQPCYADPVALWPDDDHSDDDGAVEMLTGALTARDGQRVGDHPDMADDHRVATHHRGGALDGARWQDLRRGLRASRRCPGSGHRSGADLALGHHGPCASTRPRQAGCPRGKLHRTHFQRGREHTGRRRRQRAAVWKTSSTRP